VKTDTEAIKNELQQKLANGEFTGPPGKSYNPRGAWVIGSYTNNASTIDVVSHNGVSYYCKATHTGISTTPEADTTNWGLLAAAGIDNNKMLVNPSTPTIIGHTKQVTGYGSVSAPNNAKGKVDAILKGFSLKNLLNYNNSTYAEWSKAAGVTADATGMIFTADGSNWKTANLATALLPNTQCVVVYEVVSSNLTQSFITDNKVFNFLNLTKNIGNNKVIGTTNSTITVNQFKMQV